MLASEVGGEIMLGARYAGDNLFFPGVIYSTNESTQPA